MMSKTAHKAANRSAIKQSSNAMPAKTQVEPPKATSWWTAGAAPDADAKFTELARERETRPWSNVVPTAMNPRGNFV